MTKDHARIVIVGGGVIGASIAYQLTKAGERDVLILEKAQLTHGSTWHAAGLVGQLRSKKNLTRLMQNSVAVFDGLEAETGQVIDWRKSGSLRVASSDARMTEIRRSLTQAQGFGFEAYEISPKEAQDRFPWMSLDGIVGAAWIPSDGYIDPYAVTMAFVKGARTGGVSIREGVLVTGFEIDKRRVTRVLSDHGPIGCEIVVNAAGIWAKRVGEMAGVALAAGAVEHQYIVTEKKIDVTHMTPTFRDPDRIFYLKPDVKSFAIGGWEKGAPACWPEGVPSEWGRQLFPENLDRFEPILLGAAERLPVLNEVGIKRALTAPYPSPQTASRSSARRRNLTTSTSPVASPRASLRRVGPASPRPIGLSIATRAWTCGRSTFAVLRASNRPAYTSPSEARKLTAATIRSIGRAKK